MIENQKGNMRDLASRLMLSGNRNRQTLPTAIFGTAGRMAQAIEVDKPPVRIGIWPIRSDTHPGLAMSIATVLGFLLERYQGVRTYRIFAQLGDEPADYTWSIDQSQFDVDDWQIDDLDENAALWGRLSYQADLWQLHLEIENDAADADDLLLLKYQEKSIASLIMELPAVAQDIIEGLAEVGPEYLIAPLYSVVDDHNDVLTPLLYSAFEWEIQLLLTLWGKTYTDEQIVSHLQELLSTERGRGDFGDWLISLSLARSIRFSNTEVTESLLQPIEDWIRNASTSPISAIHVGGALLDTGRVQAAYSVLEENIIQHETDALARLALAEVYRRGGRIAEAVNTFQGAIEDEVTNPNLYLRYADLLITLDFNNVYLEDFVFIESSEQVSAPLLWEAVEACEQGLRDDPDNLRLLTVQLLQMLDLDETDGRVWPRFKHLVTLDAGAGGLRSVVEALYHIDDPSPALDILEEAVERMQEQHQLRLCLAIAYLAAGESAAAQGELNLLQELTNQADILAEIQRLLISAEDPEFEARLGEITDVINAGNAINSDELDYLEGLLERAPAFGEIYPLVAKAYLSWDEVTSAIETLLDGHKHIPDDPEILALLGQILWESGEHALAFTYLNKGIAANPNYVPVLALMGQYLFEDGQEDNAKAYLARAEMIAPRDPVLARVRVNIAKLFGQ